MMTPVLILPGLFGSEEAHWQSVWLHDRPESRLVAQHDWDHPDLIRQLADLDSLAFPKRGESESLGQTGGLRCDRGFRYVKILMEKVSGVCRGSRRMPAKYDACWRSH